MQCTGRAASRLVSGCTSETIGLCAAGASVSHHRASDAIAKRHRRAPECWQVHAVQRTRRRRRCGSRELYVPKRHRVPTPCTDFTRVDPFCTIEPTLGIAVVPDERLQKLGVLNESKKTVPATLEFVDIAGLVAGASNGEGLGSKFLANIRECDAIVHVVRCFEDPDIIHVSGSVDPLRDIEVINLELALADLAQLEKRGQRSKRKDPNANPHEPGAIAKLIEGLNNGVPARAVDLTDEERESIAFLGLLTMKPVIFAANVADSDLASGNHWVDEVRKYAAENGAGVVVVSAQVEAELVALEPAERVDFLEALGVTSENCGLRALVRATYDLLGLQTFFTSGPTETRAWTIRAGALAPQAAGVIHTDFERGFIRAETIGYEQLCAVGSEKAAKEKGLMRSEGKDYKVREGDVMLFRFNV